MTRQTILTKILRGPLNTVSRKTIIVQSGIDIFAFRTHSRLKPGLENKKYHTEDVTNLTNF
jgi:hypothetical protein